MIPLPLISSSPRDSNKNAQEQRGDEKNSEDDTAPAGNYATREGALEAIYLAASNDIKKGLGVSIQIDPPAANEPAAGGRP
jgi:hypothetical protein